MEFVNLFLLIFIPATGLDFRYVITFVHLVLSFFLFFSQGYQNAGGLEFVEFFLPFQVFFFGGRMSDIRFLLFFTMVFSYSF